MGSQALRTVPLSSAGRYPKEAGTSLHVLHTTESVLGSEERILPYINFPRV